MSLADTASEALMLQTAAGDARAFDQLMTRHRGPLVGFLSRLGADEHLALDLAQEAFLRIYRRRDRYRAEAKFTTYLYRVARNLLIDDHRRRHRRPVLLAPDQLADAGPAAHNRDRLGAREVGARVRAAVDGLSDKLREVAVLRLEEQLPFSEIGHVLKIRPGTARERWRVAREELQRRLADLVEESGNST